MALTLTYDPVLSRVRIGGSTAIDAFNRTTSNGWGTAFSGHPWTTSGGAASDYSCTGTLGRHTHTATGALHHSLLDAGSADVEVITSVTIYITSSSGAAVSTFVVGRVTDTANYYGASLVLGPGSGMTLYLVKRVAGALSGNLDSAAVGTHTGGAFWRVKFRCVGSLLQAKAWLVTDAEPASWQVEVTDSSLTAGTQAGVISRVESGNTNTLPQNIDWDNFEATPIPTVVERSTNQITWSTVRGGADLPRGAITLDDYEFSPDVVNYYRAAGQAASVTPVLDGVWLKSLARPFLNRKVTVVDYSDVERSSRGGVFPIVGRSFPVAVTDLHGSRQWTLDVLAETAQEAEDLDLLISTGEVQFVHVPAAERVPGGYVALGNTTERRPGRRSVRRVFSMPLTEVAAPGPDVVPAVGTWQSVLNSYATWADVLAAHPTWESLLQLVGSPADIVVP